MGTQQAEAACMPGFKQGRHVVQPLSCCTCLQDGFVIYALVSTELTVGMAVD